MSITGAQIFGCRYIERGGDCLQNSGTSIEQGARIALYAVPTIDDTLLGLPTRYTYAVPGAAFRLGWDG